MTPSVPITGSQSQPASAPGILASQRTLGMASGNLKDFGGWLRIFGSLQVADEPLIPNAQSLTQNSQSTVGKCDGGTTSAQTTSGTEVQPVDSDALAPPALFWSASGNRPGLQLRAEGLPLEESDVSEQKTWTASESLKGSASLSRGRAKVVSAGSPPKSGQSSTPSTLDGTSSVTIAVPFGNNQAPVSSNIVPQIAALSKSATHTGRTETQRPAPNAREGGDLSAQMLSPAAIQKASSNNPALSVTEDGRSANAEGNINPQDETSADLPTLRYEHASAQGSNGVSAHSPLVTASSAAQVADLTPPDKKAARANRVAEKDELHLSAQTATSDAAGTRVHIPIEQLNSDRSSEAQQATSRQPVFGSRETFAALDGHAPTPQPTWIHAGAYRAEAGLLDPSLGWLAVRAEVHGTSVQATLIPGSRDAMTELAPQLPTLNAHLAHQEGHVSVSMGSPDTSAGGQHGRANQEDAASQPSTSFAHSRSEESPTPAVSISPAVASPGGNLVSIIV